MAVKRPKFTSKLNSFLLRPNIRNLVKLRVCDALVFRVVEPFSLRDTNQEVNLVFVCDQVLLCMLKTGPAVTDGTVLPPVGGRGQK